MTSFDDFEREWREQSNAMRKAMGLPEEETSAAPQRLAPQSPRAEREGELSGPALDAIKAEFKRQLEAKDREMREAGLRAQDEKLEAERRAAREKAAAVETAVERARLEAQRA